MAKASQDQVVTVEGRTIKLTNLDKVLYPTTRTTKADVLSYYAQVGPTMLPHVRDRPATRKRWPDGVGEVKGKPPTVFFNKSNDPHIVLNANAAEVTSDDSIDPYSPGFTVNEVAATHINVNAATYIYLAIA